MITTKPRQLLLVEFGRRVKTLRLEAHLSQEGLANIAGVHRTYVGMIERGEKNITLVNMSKISKALGVSLHELFQELESE